ncbi:MAG: L,D-transpeptidase family protein [Emergencia sp.]
MCKAKILILQLLMVLIIVGVPVGVFGLSGNLTDENIIVELSAAEFDYTGSDITPAVTVTVNGQEEPLTEGLDYKVTYENNLYPGKARVLVEGTGEYEGTVEKTFSIKLKNVTGLKLKERYAKSLKLTWNKEKGVTGYRIYQIKSGVWTFIGEVEGSSHNYYTVKNLNAATSYAFSVKSFVETDSGKKMSGLCTRLSTCTKPEPTKITEKIGLVCALKVKWEKKKCTGYEVWSSRYPDFRTIARKKTVSSKYNYAYLYDLKKEQKYYVKVRPYYVKDGSKVYGNWSYYRTVTTRPISAGWNTIKGHKYYYSQGYALKGTHYINGNPYYFDSTGKLRGSSSTMWKKAKNAASSTSWLMVTDTKTNVTCIYYRSDGQWKLKKYYRCSTGAAATPTKKGNFYVCSKGYSFSDEDYTCWYWTGFYGSEYLYHSVPYVTDSMEYFRDSRLGMNISHGCIRLKIDHAKWIYDNIPYYTKVVTF